MVEDAHANGAQNSTNPALATIRAITHNSSNGNWANWANGASWSCRSIPSSSQVRGFFFSILVGFPFFLLS
jgi:hypothetical protein